jgi:hypothetical protein
MLWFAPKTPSALAGTEGDALFARTAIKNLPSPRGDG